MNFSILFNLSSESTSILNRKKVRRDPVIDINDLILLCMFSEEIDEITTEITISEARINGKVYFLGVRIDSQSILWSNIRVIINIRKLQMDKLKKGKRTKAYSSRGIPSIMPYNPYSGLRETRIMTQTTNIVSNPREL